MKIIALDVGNVHTGVAYADPTAIIAIPYQTIATNTLQSWLAHLCSQEPISTVIIGLPTTLKGTSSQQTTSTVKLKEQLAQEFPSITWLLFDERLTSKQAQTILRRGSKKKPTSEHAIAAAIILQTYLESLRQ
jgi:putative Holliday junction resolvase